MAKGALEIANIGDLQKRLVNMSHVILPLLFITFLIIAQMRLLVNSGAVFAYRFQGKYYLDPISRIFESIKNGKFGMAENLEQIPELTKFNENKKGLSVYTESPENTF